eukprot:maker-scaffold_7-snap-gene-9.5-mRNA-1 protein AED:0.28 eAED:0.28 QI:100/1/1/1/1/1/2/149/494
MSFEESLNQTIEIDLILSPASLDLQNKGDFYEQYTVKQSLGEGTFGEVREAVQISTQEERAFKIIRIPSTNSKSKKTRRKAKRMRKLALQEAEFLSSLVHPNLLRLVEFFDSGVGLFIITDIYKGGDLFTEFTKPTRTKGFSFIEIEDVFRQMLSCLAYIHEKGVVHRDIKPENIMLEHEGDLSNIKLIDFGYAVKYDYKDPSSGLLRERAGTPYYCSPEVLKRAYNHTCDIWSLGVIGYILVSGRPPFYGETTEDIFEKVLEGKHKLHDYVRRGSKMGKLIGRMMTYDYATRPDAESLLRWLRKHKAQYSRQPTVEEIENQQEVVLSLRRFNTSCILKNLIHAFMMKKFLNKEELLKLETTFRSFDKNENGTLSLSELKGFLKQYLGPFFDGNEAEILFNQLDADGSGNIDFEEFVVGATGDRNLINTESMEVVFDFLDTDKSGDIDADEIKAMFRNSDGLLTQDIEELLKDVSGTGENRISKTDFIGMFDLN